MRADRTGAVQTSLALFRALSVPYAQRAHAMIHHLAENLVDMYDRMEPYEVCGEELREAYVGLKRLRHGDVRSSPLPELIVCCTPLERG